MGHLIDFFPDASSALLLLFQVDINDLYNKLVVFQLTETVTLFGCVPSLVKFRAVSVFSPYILQASWPIGQQFTFSSSLTLAGCLVSFHDFHPGSCVSIFFHNYA